MEISKKDKKLPNILFLSVFLLLLSFIISNMVLKSSAYLLPIMATFYILNIVLLFLFYYERNIIIKKQYFILPACSLILSVSTIIYLVSFNLNIDFKDVINSLVKALNLLLYFVMIINIKIDKKQIKYLMKLFVTLGIIACIYNLIANFKEVISFYKITSTYDVSLNSFFSNRNQFGAYLFLAIVAYTYYLDSKKINLKNIIVYGLFFINIIFTMSRGAILATMIFVVIYLILKKQIKILTILTVLGITFLIIISMFFPIMEFIETNLIRLDSGNTGRTAIWSIAKNVYKDGSILFGNGYYNGIAIAKETYLFKYSQFHSYYYDLLVSGGITELIFTSSLLIFCLKKAVKESQESNYKKIYISSFVAIFVFSIFESVNFLSLGYADMLYTIFYMTVPLMISNIKQKNGGV